MNAQSTVHQINLFPEKATPRHFRPIHYLGSKLRLLGQIAEISKSLAPTGMFCDLFAGSGTVSYAIAPVRPTISVDIQEYSRVLCSILSASDYAVAQMMRVGAAAKTSNLFKLLTASMKPLIVYERACAESAFAGDIIPLCDFIDNGSLAWLQHTGAVSAAPQLKDALHESLSRMQAEGLDKSPSSLVCRYFGGAYFSFEQAVALDALLDVAHCEPTETRDVALAPILSAASESVNTVGKHFAQPIRPRDAQGEPKMYLAQRVMRDRRVDVFSAHAKMSARFPEMVERNHQHHAVQSDVDDFLNEYQGPISLFYADPPYTRDHYSRFYHVLETMSLRDEPDFSTSLIRTGNMPRISRGFYRSERHQSPFSIKSQAPGAFSRLFHKTQRFGAPLILSYSPFMDKINARPRLMSVEAIVDLAKDFYRSVSVIPAGAFSHSKFNLQSRNAPVNTSAEIFVVCSSS
ncbi:MAG: DNA adenine methylase [Vulcanimicrobiaceae bacterium]